MAVGNKNLLLGVNIDHVATLREARGTRYPDPVQAAITAEEAGADGITLHLREDRRHISERDVLLIAEVLQTRMNLEMAATDEMVEFALQVKPLHCCLVPEKREELTTEGGLDVAGQLDRITNVTSSLTEAGIEVSLFIDAEREQIDAAHVSGASTIEIHTGKYADATSPSTQSKELAVVIEGISYAVDKGLIVNAGHGLNYHNVQQVAAIPGLNELNIGHSIIARAVFSGLYTAVRDMKMLIQGMTSD